MDSPNLSSSAAAENGGQKILFIDRDGTIIKEAPPTYQIDSFDKLEFYPNVFTWLG